MTRVLFICKQRPATYGASYGLLNSCRFLCNALHEIGVECKLVEVIDNNHIDREVYHYKPTHVFIEALWVVPEKFEVLIPLHPHVKWYVRLHSNTPFLSNEGMAIDWIKRYKQIEQKYHQFKIAPNSLKMVEDLKLALNMETTYAPNIYFPSSHHDDLKSTCINVERHHHVVNIGCFGAIRPLKNQLIQAMAAMAFANEMGKILHFHINHTRIETHGENTYKNLISLFEGTHHKLITHDWMLHHQFIHLINQMDLGLQMSFSETFNIVAADFVYSNIPIIGSEEIEWMDRLYQANPTDINDIVGHLKMAYKEKDVNLQQRNLDGLLNYNDKAIKTWKKLLGKHDYHCSETESFISTISGITI